MPETEHFINDGSGWTCRRCSAAGGGGSPAGADDEATPAGRAAPLPRFFREGEDEDQGARLSTRALARWTDETRRALLCPRCGAEEALPTKAEL